MDIKGVVQKLVARYGSNDPFHIAEMKNIIIVTEPLGNILGYHNSDHRFQIIHICRGLDSHLRRFVCAHELGHAILHPKVNTPFLRRNTLFSVDKIERQANHFAVTLLTCGEKAGEDESLECFYLRNNVPVEMIGKI